MNAKFPCGRCVIISRRRALALAISLGAFVLSSFGAEPATHEPVQRQWTIDGVVRQALVYIPERAKTEPTPIVFAFHGHSGTMGSAARSFGYHKIWPEAIAVYMQGLNTPGRLTDPEGKKPGWQSRTGMLDDRDLKFFDAVLASLRQDYRVDDKRIYSTGHSNGGGFTYLLWSARGDCFAALAPSAAAAPGMALALGATKPAPKPLLIVAGEKDPLVKFAWQKEMIAALRKYNQCDEGQPWEKLGTLYPSKVGAPLVTIIHPGTHTFLSSAPELIVKFFKSHAKP